ncbi:MAG TPA: ABC transporter permease, partial [Blastocatellia bacterium]|nr:ABC transporter permease [Blastocatellia bacterium]
MKPYFKLFRQFILRSLAREKMRSAVTALGISLGVAVTIAIRLANVSALESFRTATESVAGETSIQITGAGGRFDEKLLGDLAWLREYGEISPVITGYAMADWYNYSNANRAVSNINPQTRGRYGEFLQVLGVDVLRDRAFRRYQLIRTSERDHEPNAREFLLLLADPNSIILTEEFARRRGLSIGSTFALTMSDKRHEFTVRGLLLNEGP